MSKSNGLDPQIEMISRIESILTVKCRYDDVNKSGRVCHQTGKHIHASKGEAQAHLWNLKQQKEANWEVYVCRFCGGWHVGRAKQKAHNSKH